jgi:flagellar protein FliL
MAAQSNADDAPEDDEDRGADGGSAKPATNKGLVGRVLGAPLALLRLVRFLNPLTILKLPLKQKLMAATALTALLGAIGGGAYFVLLAPAPPAVAEAGAKPNAPDLPPPQTAYFDVPDIIVNLQTPDSTPAYLKLSVALELDKAEDKAAIEPVLPRVVDQFQTYLRELRVEDLRGSAGVMRLKEELLRRVNLAVAPTPVRDVLLKEMIVQ